MLLKVKHPAGARWFLLVLVLVLGSFEWFRIVLDSSKLITLMVLEDSRQLYVALHGCRWF